MNKRTRKATGSFHFILLLDEAELLGAGGGTHARLLHLVVVGEAVLGQGKAGEGRLGEEEEEEEEAKL